MSGQGKQLEGIQYLRAIAALMVVLFHLSSYAGALLTRAAERFPSGVDIFFVVSGFIMLITSRRATPLSFLRRRIVRIVPLYWLLTVAIYAIAFPTVHRHAPVELIKSLLFIPYPDIHGSAYPMPIISPGWSLNLEMYFYVLFAVTLLAPLRRGAVLILGVLFSVLIGLHDSVAAHHSLIAFYFQPRIIEFWAGMAIGWMYLNGKAQASVLIAISSVVVGFAALVAFDLPFQLPAILVIAGVVCLEGAGRIPRWPLLGYLGDASYSTYLTHAAVIEAGYQVWRRLHLPDGVAFALVSLVVALGCGVLCYRFIETPLLRMWHKPRVDRAQPFEQTGVAAGARLTPGRTV